MNSEGAPSGTPGERAKGRNRAIAIVIAIAAIVVLSVTAIVLLGSPTPAPGEARVRVIHASPDAPAVDVWVNDAPAFTNVAFKQQTAYATLDAGTYNVKVVPAGATSPVVIEADLALAADADYTVAAIGVLANIEPLVLVDDVTPDADAHVRFVHASPDAPAVDIAVRDGPVLFSNVAFGEARGFTDVAPGDYRLEVRLAGTSTVVLELGLATFAGQRSYTAYAVGLVGDDTLTAIGIDAVQESRVRVVHASPDAPAVDVWVNDAPAFTDVAFQGITPYAWLPAGTHNVKVVPAGATSPVVIEANLTLDPNVEYSVVATGLLADITPLVLVDGDEAVAAGKAWVRFVHASPDAPSVDIAVRNGSVLFSDVAFREVANYLEVSAGTYDLEVRLAGMTTVVLDLTGIPLMTGVTYTVHAMGLAGDQSLTAVLAVDA